MACHAERSHRAVLAQPFMHALACTAAVRRWPAMQDGATGQYLPCLAPEQLAAMYVRITEAEIQAPPQHSASQHSVPRPGAREPQGRSLAAAVGLTQLLLPFRCAWSAGTTMQALRCSGSHRPVAGHLQCPS